MIPALTFATLPGSLLAGGFDPQPVLVVDAASLAPLLAPLVGLVVALFVARTRRPRGVAKTAFPEAHDVRAAA